MDCETTWTLLNVHVAVINPSKTIDPQNYPTLFRFFETMKDGIRLSKNVFVFNLTGDSKSVVDYMFEHLLENDEVMVFQISEAAWRVG